jgi:uncharacterized protein YdaU (DUF1376 family)
MNALPYLPWFCGDFMTATRGWSVTARGVYRELLDAQWDAGGLTADPKALRDLIRATPGEWRAAWSLVEPKFPVGPDGLRRNPRLEVHRQKALQISAIRAEVGRRGGLARVERERARRRSNGAPA